MALLRCAPMWRLRCNQVSAGSLSKPSTEKSRIITKSPPSFPMLSAWTNRYRLHASHANLLKHRQQKCVEYRWICLRNF